MVSKAAVISRAGAVHLGSEEDVLTISRKARSLEIRAVRMAWPLREAGSGSLYQLQDFDQRPRSGRRRHPAQFR